MNPISTEFNQFFKELAANNHKDWFDLNRKRYETHVKKPFEDFVEQLIEAVQKEDKSLNPKPKDCIFRINRDIRFSKDNCAAFLLPQPVAQAESKTFSRDLLYHCQKKYSMSVSSFILQINLDLNI